MTKKETIESLCEIVGVVYNTIGDYSHFSECFCNPELKDSLYRNDGKAIEYVRRAVNRALIEDGFDPVMSINDLTGEYDK